MKLTLESDGNGRFVLPAALREAGLQIMIVNRWVHLAQRRGVGYFTPPLCGASTASRNVKRERDVGLAVIPMCNDCARHAGLLG